MENKLYELRQDVISPVSSFKKGDRKFIEEWRRVLNITDSYIISNKEWFKEIELPIFNREDFIGAIYDIIIKIKRLPKLGSFGRHPAINEDILDSFLIKSDEENLKMIEMLVDDYLKK